MLTDLRGGHNGHGKEFNRYAKYIREHTKNNIQRYSCENTDIIEDNLLKGLNIFNQKKLLEEKMNIY